MPKGGTLTIETANVELDERYFRKHGVENEAGRYVMLVVADNGVGMNTETQTRISEFFSLPRKWEGEPVSGFPRSTAL
jgi:signal transduction histidine kinase